MKWFPALSFLVLLSCNDVTDQPVPVKTYPKNDSNKITEKEPANPFAPVDISPVDMSYFPPDYPVSKMAESNTAPPVARVIYSRPHKQGRKIFGSLVKWGEYWRLGANEATELEFFRPVTIAGKKVAKGRYMLYAIPQEKSWIIVFNSNVYSWGLKHDETKDLYKFSAATETINTPVEYFTIVFEETTSGANLLMAWDDVAARLPINF